MRTVVIIFKSGTQLKVRCENCTIQRHFATNAIVSCSFENVKNINPMYIDITEIACIYEEVFVS